MSDSIQHRPLQVTAVTISNIDKCADMVEVITPILPMEAPKYSEKYLGGAESTVSSSSYDCSLPGQVAVTSSIQIDQKVSQKRAISFTNFIDTFTPKKSTKNKIASASVSPSSSPATNIDGEAVLAIQLVSPAYKSCRNDEDNLTDKKINAECSVARRVASGLERSNTIAGSTHDRLSIGKSVLLVVYNTYYCFIIYSDYARAHCFSYRSESDHFRLFLIASLCDTKLRFNS